MYRWSTGSIGGAGGRSAAQRGILTTWLILSPREPPPLRAVSCGGPPPPGAPRSRTRGGFPRPRASRPLTTHGAPHSAAASRAATRAAVALILHTVPCPHRPVISFMLISARWFSCRVTAVKTSRVIVSAEWTARCWWTFPLTVKHTKPVRTVEILYGAFSWMRFPTGEYCCDLRPEMLRPWPSCDSDTKRKICLIDCGISHARARLPSYLHGAYEWILFSSGAVCVRRVWECASSGRGCVPTAKRVCASSSSCPRRAETATPCWPALFRLFLSSARPALPPAPPLLPG